MGRFGVWIGVSARCLLALAVFISCLLCAKFATAGENSSLNQIAAMSVQEFQEVENKAARGDATSQAILAIAYEQGVHVVQDDAEAAKWYRRLAERSSAAARNRLGVFYQVGRGVPQSYTEAAEWFQKAATMGEPAAQANLGTLYLNGWGVLKSADEAAKWYEVSARQGNQMAQNNLAYMYSSGLGVVKDKARAAYWYREAAKQGDGVAALNLGLLCEEGIGGAPDEREALRWFVTAAEKGVARGYSNQARLYMFGKQTPHDYARAYELVEKAVNAGDEVVRPWLQKCREQMAQSSPPATK